MVLPKRYTRKITIDEKGYNWHLNHDCPEFTDHITIQEEGMNGQYLIFEGLPWDFEIRPENIRRIIQKALELGWSPEKKTQPFKLKREDVSLTINLI